jgi:GntR family transcriptional repressor for pyruvate dehydrogenase complex
VVTDPPDASSQELPDRLTRRPLRVTSLVSQVENLIEEMCVGSDFRPGDELPAEAHLAEAFGVSRVVVREAMRVVEARGFVRRRQGKQAVVNEPNARPLEDFAVRSALRSKRSLLELTEVRKALEVHAARQAALRVRTDDVARQVNSARELIATMRQRRPNARQRAALDIAFHHALAEMSGNAMLAQMLAALDKPLNESREENHRASLRSAADPATWVDEHEQLLDAILNGDPHDAVTAMEEHLNLSLREIETRPNESTTEQPAL